MLLQTKIEMKMQHLEVRDQLQGVGGSSHAAWEDEQDQVLLRKERESSLWTTNWPGPIVSPGGFSGPALCHGSFDFPFPGSLISTFLEFSLDNTIRGHTPRGGANRMRFICGNLSLFHNLATNITTHRVILVKVTRLCSNFVARF